MRAAAVLALNEWVEANKPYLLEKKMSNLEARKAAAKAIGTNVPDGALVDCLIKNGIPTNRRMNTTRSNIVNLGRRIDKLEQAFDRMERALEDLVHAVHSQNSCRDLSKGDTQYARDLDLQV